MSRSPAKKRARRSASTDEDDPAPHPTFWFPDGSVVLQAGNVQFKVHQSTLALHSPVFEGLFAAATPCEKERVDGLPLVQLYGDAASDVEAMLGALLGRGRLYNPQNPIAFDTLRAFLHMADKYDVPALRTDALARLRAKFPAPAQDPDYLAKSEGVPWRVEPHPGIEFELADLARQHHAWDVLPALYLRVLTHDGFKWEHVLDGFPIPNTTPVRMLKLAPPNRRALLLGERRLVRHQSAALAAWHAPTGTCTSARTCTDALARTRLAHADPRFYLAFWGAWRDGLAARLCSACSTRARELYVRQQAETWARLPTFFDLPSWDVLYACAEKNQELPVDVDEVTV